MIVNRTLNKIISKSPALQETLLDLTNDSVAPGNLAQNETAHDREGENIVGSFITEDAEAWAVGRRNGVPVLPNDPTYHNNSYWYSQVSEDASIVSGSCMRIAGEYADIAEDNAITSGSAMRIAGEYKDDARDSMIISGSFMHVAGEHAEDSEAWAVGKRGGQEVPSTDPTYHNNAEHWAKYAQEHAGGGIHYKESILFANIPTTGMSLGDMYDIKDDFTTDSRFQDGAGIACDAGTNIIWNANEKWDIDPQGSGGGHTIVNSSGTEMIQRSKLQFEGCEVTDDSTNDITKVKAKGSVTGVKGNKESDYRTGNVNITPANIGALATNGDGKDVTVTYTTKDAAANTTEKTNTTTDQPSTIAKLTSGETLASMFGKISAMFKNIRKLWNTVGTSALASGKTVTGLLGKTDISGVGSTVTGAISTLGNRTTWTVLQSGTLTNQNQVSISGVANYSEMILVVKAGSCCGSLYLPVAWLKSEKSNNNYFDFGGYGSVTAYSWFRVYFQPNSAIVWIQGGTETGSMANTASYWIYVR